MSKKIDQIWLNLNNHDLKNYFKKMNGNLAEKAHITNNSSPRLKTMTIAEVNREIGDHNCSTFIHNVIKCNRLDILKWCRDNFYGYNQETILYGLSYKEWFIENNYEQNIQFLHSMFELITSTEEKDNKHFQFTNWLDLEHTRYLLEDFIRLKSIPVLKKLLENLLNNKIPHFGSEIKKVDKISELACYRNNYENIYNYNFPIEKFQRMDDFYAILSPSYDNIEEFILAVLIYFIICHPVIDFSSVEEKWPKEILFQCLDILQLFPEKLFITKYFPTYLKHKSTWQKFLNENLSIFPIYLVHLINGYSHFSIF
jgi:hypothetical protein